MAKTVSEFRFPKVDPRLLGTWKSDRRRTFKHWLFRPDISAENQKRLKALFGKLTVTYTRTSMVLDLNGHTSKFQYRVIGTDPGSVAIAYTDSLTSLPAIQHIHFDGNHYWITVGDSSQREFFKKCKNDA